MNQVIPVDTKIAKDILTTLKELRREMAQLQEKLSASRFPFVSPDTKSAAGVLKSFKKTRKYSKEFLKDLEEGLRESTYFTK